jgi:chromosome segregation ATPase
LADTHQRTCEEMQTRVRELTGAAREADQRRQQAETEGQRAATAFARAQAEWAERQRELNTLLSQLRQQAENAAGSCTAKEVEALEEQLAATREDFGRRMEQQTGQLLQLDQALKAALEERRRTGEELVRAREELATKSAEYVAAMAKAAEEVKLVWSELQAQPKPDSAPKATEVQEVAELKAALENEVSRRVKAEEQLQQARSEVQERLRQFASALGQPPVAS